MKSCSILKATPVSTEFSIIKNGKYFILYYCITSKWKLKLLEELHVIPCIVNYYIYNQLQFTSIFQILKM